MIIVDVASAESCEQPSPGDMLAAAAAEAAASPLLTGWTVTTTSQDGRWTVYRPPERDPMPTDGLKIHVSASLTAAPAVLRAVLPVLAASEVPFKHAATQADLGLLASGRLGFTQVGKFLTVYPRDPDQTVALAWQLHARTTHLSGPRIRHDEQLAPGSLVHLRRGAFQPRWLQLPSGRIVPATQGERGLKPDNRTGDEEASAQDLRLVGGKYARVHWLHESPKGSTWMGFGADRDPDEVLIIKEARAFVFETPDGADARSRLHNETQVLRALANCGRTPEVVDAWDEPACSYLVYRLVDGPTLAHVVSALTHDCLRPPLGVVQQWARQLCETVATVHDVGFVVGDVKPSNLVLTEDGFHLVDLELAGPPTDAPVPGIGTPGFCSPQQCDPGCGRHVTDDVYAVAATLFAVATLVDPGTLPDPLKAARFELAHHPDDPVMAAIVGGLDPDPRVRFASPRGLADAAAGPTSRNAGGVPKTADGVGAVGMPPRPDFLDLARRVGDRLLGSAPLDQSRRRRLHWLSDHPNVAGTAGRDLYCGAAGTALFLAELAEATGDDQYLDGALGAGRWLAEEPPAYATQRPMPGLFFGQAGHGLLYLRLFEATGDESWLETACDIGELVASTPSHSPDLLTGDAGVVLYLVAVHAHGGGEHYLDAAGRIVDRLIATADRRRPTWTIPDGHDGLSGQSYVGLSHGSAGVGLALATYALASGESRACRWAGDVAEWTVEQAVQGAAGLAWRIADDPASPVATYWCHGSAGIVSFLTAAHQLRPEPALVEAIHGAARGVAAHSWWSGTTYCHGLAGNADSLIGIWQATGDPAALDAAYALADNLMTYATDAGWPAESRDHCPPDLLVGEAGVGAALLRLADPHRPSLLRAGPLIDAGTASDANAAAAESIASTPEHPRRQGDHHAQFRR